VAVRSRERDLVRASAQGGFRSWDARVAAGEGELVLVWLGAASPLPLSEAKSSALPLPPALACA